MNLNELLAKQNFISKVLLKNGDDELSKELKVKVMKIRIAYNGVKKQFDEDMQEFQKEVVPEELQTLSQKEERSEQENERLNTLISKANEDIREFASQKGIEEVNLPIDDTLTELDYESIVEVNADNDVEINGIKVTAPDFLEALYTLFVKSND